MPSLLSVIYEDNHLLVVNKPAGVLVQGDRTGDKPLVEVGKEYIKERYHKPGEVFLGVVHRLDRPVSGLVVFARTSKALERMNKLFRDKETVKTYYAIVNARPPKNEDVLVHWLRKDEKKNKTTAFMRETDNALRSELRYETVGSVDGGWVVRVNPVTGRPHQIRVQLASIGCTIKGDVKYGDPAANTDGSIYLHARRLSFVHPIKKEPVVFQASFPDRGPWKKITNAD